jgi:hypothetical protein
LCRFKWRGGCKNKLCPLNEWLDDKLGCASSIIKPPLFIISAPIALSLAITGGSVLAAGAVVCGAISLPVIATKKAFKAYKDRKAEKARRTRFLSSPFSSNVYNGVGITFVGASDEFQEFVNTLEGRAIFEPGAELLGPGPNFIVDGETRVIYANYAMNVVFRSTRSQAYPTVAAFDGDSTSSSGPSSMGPRSNNSPSLPRGADKPHLVYICHEIDKEGPDAIASHMTSWTRQTESVHHRSRIQSRLMTNTNEARRRLRVIHLRTELFVMCPTAMTAFREGILSWRRDNLEVLTDELEEEISDNLPINLMEAISPSELFDLVQIHAQWVLCPEIEATRATHQASAYSIIEQAGRNFSQRKSSKEDTA